MHKLMIRSGSARGSEEVSTGIDIIFDELIRFGNVYFVDYRFIVTRVRQKIEVSRVASV